MVDRAEDLRLGRAVALKFLLPQIRRQGGEVECANALVETVARDFEQFRGGQPKRSEDFVDLARIRLLQRDREEALRLLEEAVRRGWRFLSAQPNAPVMESLRGDPRYDRLMADVEADIARTRARVEREGW